VAFSPKYRDQLSKNECAICQCVSLGTSRFDCVWHNSGQRSLKMPENTLMTTLGTLLAALSAPENYFATLRDGEIFIELAGSVAAAE
jgi:hypothetical protein